MHPARLQGRKGPKKSRAASVLVSLKRPIFEQGVWNRDADSVSGLQPRPADAFSVGGCSLVCVPLVETGVAPKVCGIIFLPRQVSDAVEGHETIDTCGVGSWWAA